MTAPDEMPLSGGVDAEARPTDQWEQQAQRVVPEPRLHIVLARHGCPDLPDEARRAIRGREIGRWYRRYDEAGIVAGVGAPEALRAAARTAGCIVASDARRAVESATRLAPAGAITIEASLREVGFPESLPSSIRLSPHLWVSIARASQMLDRDDDEGGRAAVRARAAIAAGALVRLARDHHRVVAIGHGWFNRFVARELRRQGWRGPRLVPSGYWSNVTYERAGSAESDAQARAATRLARHIRVSR